MYAFACCSLHDGGLLVIMIVLAVTISEILTPIKSLPAATTHAMAAMAHGSEKASVSIADVCVVWKPLLSLRLGLVDVVATSYGFS